MPESSPKTPADRVNGTLTDVHPRLDGSIIPTPDDICEGRGDFTHVNEAGQPDGLKVVSVESSDGWDVLVGETPDKTYQQNSAPLPISRPSFLDDQPWINNGLLQPSPNDPLLAKIAKPATPLLKPLKVEQAGFPGTTPEAPMWYAYGWYRQGDRTQPSPSVPFQIATGQGVTVSWEEPPPDAEGVVLYLSEPGTTTATSDGVMREQRTLFFDQYQLNTHALSGPYREGDVAPTTNETELLPPDAPVVFIVPGAWIVGGSYHFYLTLATPNGETTPSPAETDDIAVGQDGRHFQIFGPRYWPSGATGWYAYVQKHETEEQGGKDILGRVFYRSTGAGHTAGEGRDFPLSLFGHLHVPTSGDVTEGVGPYDVDISSTDLPTENTTGVTPPDSAPEIPIPYGGSRNAGGRKYVRVTERVGSRRSVASDAVMIDLAFDEILRVVRRDHTNLLANADNVELDLQGLPLDHTIVTTGGAVRVEDQELVLETLSAQTGTTPSDTLDAVEVDTSLDHALWGFIELRNPPTGTLAGQVDIVLREIDGVGTPTDTVLFSYTLPGEYEYYQIISKVDSQDVVLWQDDTVEASVVIRFSGATKNLHVRSSRLVLKDHRYKFRWLGNRRPSGADQRIDYPPSVATPVETATFPETDRPKKESDVRETLTFDSGLPDPITTGWTQNVSGGATLTASATAAITGSQGLLLKDTTTGSVSAAYLSKVFDEAGGYAQAFSRKLRIPTLPNGKLTLGGLARPPDGELFAWLETGSLPEVSSLTITSSPTDPGNIGVVAQGASASVPVVATKQVETLNLTSGPAFFGTITVNLARRKFNVNVGGSKEAWQLSVSRPRHNGHIILYFNNVPYPVPVRESESAVQTAARIRQWGFPGWNTSGSGNICVFEAPDPGPKIDPIYVPYTSGTPGTLSLIQAGSNETAVELASRIAALNVEPEYKVTYTPGSTTIAFTGVQAGAKDAPSIDFGITGTTGTLVTTTVGAVDTPSALAARIRGFSFTGWIVSGSGANVILTSTTPGAKTDLRVNLNGTGVGYQVTTLQQGKDSDLTAHVRDDNGVERTRMIVPAFSSSTVINVELVVQGAGTNQGMVLIYASTGASSRTLVGYWQNLSLVEYEAGVVDVGVTAEAAASETWEVHQDEIEVTYDAKNSYEEFDLGAQRIGQFYHYAPPSQPVRSDVGLQQWFEACIPGNQYTFGCKARHDSVTDLVSAKPTFITAHLLDGSKIDIGDIVGDLGLTESLDWTEYTRTVTAPPNCYAFGIQSRDLGPGEIVVQRIACSPGTTVKRTGAYAPQGTYLATLHGATPVQAGVNVPSRGVITYWRHRRRYLDAIITTPGTSTQTTRYRASDTEGGLASATWYTDPLLVRNYAFVQSEVVLTGDGTATSLPVLKSGSPRLLYELISGQDPISTLLRDDRSELEGGAVFEWIREWSGPPEVAMGVQPGMHLRPQIRGDNALTIPEGASLYFFTLEGLREFENTWYLPWVIETDDEALTVRLSSRPVIPRVTVGLWKDDRKFSVWVATLPWMEILKKEPFA